MIGTTVSHYKILEQLGQGGMGVVYKAQDTRLKRTVALKFLSPGALGGHDERVRFINEARTAAALSHPNICTVYEIDEVDDKAFIAMEYISGRNLRQIVNKGPMKLETAVAIAIQTAEGLQEAHEAGVVHRDIKSANIMMTDKGRPMIMDFGLAKQSGATAVTRDGVSLGTIDYMSPEQAQGHDIDQRTDLWSLGVMLFEMISGRLPFKGDKEHAVIYAILNNPVEPLTGLRTGVPMELERVVTKALAKNPNERYQTATDMLVDLRAVQSAIGDASTIATSVHAAAHKKSSVSRRILERKVPHVLAIYAVAAIALVMFLDYLVNRYPVSPHLPDVGLAALLTLVPTVIILTYFRGGSPVRVGVPTNIILAGILLALVFQNKDLGATTTAVTVADEAGNPVKRDIPKSQFRKRVALFFLDNETGDENYDWMSHGLIHLLRYDLYQDNYLTVTYGFTERLREAGFSGGTGAPLTLKRKIADDYHYDVFVAGSFTKRGEVFHIDAGVHAVRDARSLASLQYDGTDIFALIDQMSVDVRGASDLPDYHVAETQDLPASEILTASIEALEAYSKAGIAGSENEWGDALDYILPAVESDPAFAVANWRLAGIYMSLNRGDEAARAISRALEHKYKLPERIQIQLTGQYYNVRNDAEASFENAKRWVTLYPGEVAGHATLAGHYERMSRLDEAIAERQIIRELEPQDYDELLQIGRLYEIKGEYTEALNYFQQYADAFPDKYESFTRIGELYRTIGDHEKAREYFRKALLIEPERTSIRVTLAQIEQSVGNLEGAERACLDALANARTAQDSSSALLALSKFYAFRGQGKKALQTHEQMMEVMATFTPPVNLVFIDLFAASMYVMAGYEDQAWLRLEAIESSPTMIPHMKPIISVGYMIAYFATWDPSRVEEARPHLKVFESWVDQSGSENLRWAVEWCRSVIQEWDGEREEALASIQRALDSAGQGPERRQEFVTMSAHAARVCYNLKRFEQGFTFAEQALAVEPYDAFANHEIALLYRGMGRQDEANKHLARSLFVYENADPVNPMAKRIWATRDEWVAEGIQIQ